MKRAILAAALAASTLLASCDERVNTSNPQAFQKSIDAMMEGMTTEEKTRFAHSLQAIAFDTAEVGEGTMMGGYAPTGLVLMAAAEKIKGKTADQIVRLGYETRIARLDATIAEGLQTVQAAQAERLRHKATFDAIRIEGGRFYVNRQYIVEPVIEFRITNGSNIALRRGFFQGTLISEGRTIPWVDEQFNHEFSGGLEPGESRLLTLSPNMFGEWGQGDHINRRDLNIKVTVVNVEDSDGQKLLTGQPEDPAALQRELTRKQGEKSKLEGELAAL